MTTAHDQMRGRSAVATELRTKPVCRASAHTAHSSTTFICVFYYSYLSYLSTFSYIYRSKEVRYARYARQTLIDCASPTTAHQKRCAAMRGANSTQSKQRKPL